jgi:hypothetical protein
MEYIENLFKSRGSFLNLLDPPSVEKYISQIIVLLRIVIILLAIIYLIAKASYYAIYNVYILVTWLFPGKDPPHQLPRFIARGNFTLNKYHMKRISKQIME